MPRLIPLITKRILLALLLSFASVPSVALADPCFALVDAIFKEKPRRIEKALGRLSDVNCLPEGRNAKRKNGYQTPLISAISMKNLPLIEQLLERGADPDMLSRWSLPPVSYTAGDDEAHVRIRELLGQAGANFNVVWPFHGETFNMLVGYYSSEFGARQSPAYVEEMLSRGVDPLWENESGTSFVSSVEKRGQILQNANPDQRQALGGEDFDVVKQILAEYLAEIEAREAEIARREEAARRLAESQALEQRVEARYQKDLALPADLRRDKYLVSINRHLRLEEYLDAAFFYALLDRNGEAVSGDALFFRGETYTKLGMSDKAMETFHEYAVKEGASGPYYVQALQESLRLTRTQHEESGGSDLGAFIAAGDRSLDDLIRADKYTVGLSAAIQSGSYRDAVMFLRLIEELGVVLDGSQQFYYAQSLLNLGEREQGIQKLYAYLNSEGTAGQHYARALELLAEFE